MARKSASQAKPVKAEKKTEEQLWKEMESVFDDAKWTYIETVRVQIQNAKRVDNFLNLRELAMKLGYTIEDEEGIKFVKKLQELSVKTYEAIKDVAETFKMEDFIWEKCLDPLKQLMPSVDEINTQADMVAASIRFMSVTPYGNNVIQVHNLMMQEMARRGLKPKVEEEQDGAAE